MFISVNWRPLFCFVLLLVFSGFSHAEEEAGQVVIVANSADIDSMRLARHYAEARGVPTENIFAFDLPSTESINWQAFSDRLWSPLLAQLVDRGLIDAIPMDVVDQLGRKRYVVNGHHIRAIAVCRGIPLKIQNAESLYNEAEKKSSSPFRVNYAAVDAELALLPQPDHNLGGYVPNPLFSADKPTFEQLRLAISVSRLDGPSYEDAEGLIDRAIQGEKQGLVGRAYIDIGGPHAFGDKWLETCANEIRDLHFDLTVQREKGMYQLTDRFDAPVLYFGWYSGTVNGPFLADGFRFPPGALALQIHSFSAGSIRNPNTQWVGPLVARGVTGTWGNVNEPYLEFTHQPHLLVKAFKMGMNFSQASLYALRGLSWQGVAIGDPLYQPFSTDEKTIWDRRDELPYSLKPYAILREVNRLEAEDHADEALELLKQSLGNDPSFPVALALAQRQTTRKETDAARFTLGLFVMFTNPRAIDLPLFLEAGRMLVDADGAQDAVKIYDHLLERGDLDDKVRVKILKRGVEAAKAAQDFSKSIVWEREITKLSEPAAGTPAQK